jgi:hypothetical protein
VAVSEVIALPACAEHALPSQTAAEVASWILNLNARPGITLHKLDSDVEEEHETEEWSCGGTLIFYATISTI